MTRMDEQARRECRGCDGRGSVTVRVPWLHQPADSGAWETDVTLVWCAACEGEGVVTERVPIQDAVADAETLRLMVEQTRRPKLKAALRDAGFFGSASVEYHPSWADRAARSAFCAVPGLRGE